MHVPYDILREIILLSNMYIPKPEEIDEPELDLHLVSPPIAASHVCRSWRYDLVSDPFMWTCLLIPQIKPSGIIEILRRSGSAPLNVFLIIKHPYRQDHYDRAGVLKALFRQIHRFKILHLQVNIWGYYRPRTSSVNHLEILIQTVLPYLRQPAPNLETLRFWYKNTSRLDQTFLTTLFSGEAPNLKQIHYRPSFDFRESSCSLFHNLSELYLTVPAHTIELSHLLDFIGLSPHLKLLRVYRDGGSAIAYQFPSSFRKVNLPFLERIILEVDCTSELVDLILECVTFSRHTNWHITVQHQRYNDSPHLPELVSRAHFATFRILFNQYRGVDLTLKEEEHGPQYLNQFSRNKLVFMFDGADHFAMLLDTASPYIETLSSITYFDLVFESTVESTVFLKILRTMQNLKSLTVRQKTVGPYYDAEEPCVSCLSALIPLLSNINTGITEKAEPNPSQEPYLSSLSILSLEDNAPFTDSIPSAPTSAALLCPLLHELTVELSDSLNKVHASMLRVCSDGRRKEAYPLRILVRCPDIEEGVESMIQTGENDTIHVLIDNSL